MRYDAPGCLSRRSSRANSISMESRHARKPSEDACMSDGGNNSGSERSRRHSPAVVTFERSVRRSALLVMTYIPKFRVHLSMNTLFMDVYWPIVLRNSLNPRAC
jgi:hypothetical protein